MCMMTKLYATLLLVALCRGTSNAFEFNETSCSDLRPTDISRNPLDTPPPYDITVDPPYYTPGLPVTVYIDSTDGLRLRAAMVATRCQSCVSEYVGSFQSDASTQTIDCGSVMKSAISTVGQGSVTQTSLSFVWIAPATLSEDIVFRASAVRQNKYWNTLVSAPISLIEETTPSSPPSSSAPSVSSAFLPFFICTFFASSSPSRV